jgi:cellulase (glycosyl hydrolase family 5)
MSGVVERGRHYLIRDGRPFVPVGAHYVPVEGPDWPWRTDAAAFDRAFAAMAWAGLDTVRIDLLWAAIEPEPGRYDEAHLAVLDEILEAARRHGLLLHPCLFVGGEVGDAYWDVPWRAGRHPHRDPDLVAIAVAQARALAERWRGDPTIVAWDLADEPPHWLFRDTTDDEARAWTAALCAGLREVDPDHLVTVGTASQEIGAGPFRADVVADLLDVATVHPYPTYEPGLYPDDLLSTRLTHAAAFETALAAGAGRPVWVHEYGVSSAQFDPALVADYDRLLAWSAFGRGAIGFLAWCWTDAEPAAFARAPYVRQPHEAQFGVTDHLGALRPRGRVLAELAATMDALGDDLDRLAGNGPVAAAAIPVPHEYVRPYDRDAYGLDEGRTGPYQPAERAWDPDRDHMPLVRGWLNAFVLAARAGVSLAFERERLDDAWPGVPLVIVPAPLTSTSSSLLHVRTSFWAGATAHLVAGRSAWLSMSGDGALPEMAAVAGCHLADRVPAGRPGTLTFERGWGPFQPGEVLTLPDGDGALASRWARLALDDGEVVAIDADGGPGLVVARRGDGVVATCAAPVELLLGGQPGAHGPADRSWGLYAGLLAEAGIREPASVDHPDVTCGTLGGPSGGLAVVANHGPTAVRVGLRLPAGAKRTRRFGPTGVTSIADARPLDGGLVVGLDLDAHGATIVGWDDPA